MVVVDSDGVEHEIAGNICPDGFSVKAPLSFMDAEQQRNAAAWRDEQHDDDDADDASDDADEHEDADDGGDDSDDLTDEEKAEQRRASAYADFRASLDYRSRRRRNFVSDPPSQRLRKGERGLDAAADDGDMDARTKAYAARSRWLTDAWRINRDRKRGPWLRGESAWRADSTTKPAWSAHGGGAPPSVGPTGRSPYSGAHKDAREQAYANYVDRISNAWRQNKRPYVPPLEEAGS